MSKMTIKVREATEYPEFSQEERDAFEAAVAKMGMRASVEKKSIVFRFPTMSHVKMFITPWPGPNGNGGVHVCVAPPWDFTSLLNDVRVTCRYSDHSENLSEATYSILKDAMPLVEAVNKVITAMIDMSPIELNF